MATWAEIEDGSIYSCNLDVYHPPLSEDWKTSNTVHDTLVSDDGEEQLVRPKLHIDSLPPELRDMIFDLLSIPTLDAARFVSKDWYARVTNEPRFLSNALALPMDTPAPKLWAAFDQAATLIATRRHPDCWRSRFRLSRIQVAITPGAGSGEHGPENQEILSTVYSPHYNLFFIETRDIPSSTKSIGTPEPFLRSLCLYRILTQNTVDFVCQLDLPLVEGSTTIRYIQELDFGSRWRISIETGSVRSVYDIKVLTGWQKGENPYEQIAVDPSTQDVFFKDAPATMPPNEQQSYRLLSKVPPDGTSFDEQSKNTVRFPYFDADGSEMERRSIRNAFSEPIMGYMFDYFLAQDEKSGEVQMIRHNPHQTQCQVDGNLVPETADDSNSARCTIMAPEHDLEPRKLASLSPPIDGDYVFRNLAVATTIIKNSRGRPVVLVGVIWQPEYSLNDNVHLLYLYELPWSLASEGPTDIGTLTGKRISSVFEHFGGIHPESPLLKSGSLSESNDSTDASTLAALGGMRFPPRPDTTDTWTNQWCKLLLWGPPSSPDSKPQLCTSVELKIFDFSFMTVERLAASDVPKVHFVLQPIDGSTQAEQEAPPPPRRKMMSSRIQNCCCVLHDEVWYVELPRMEIRPEASLQAAAPSSPPSSLPSRTPAQLFPPSISPWRLAVLRFLSPKSNPAPEPDAKTITTERNEGTITRQYSLNQRAAMAREEEWTKRRIVGMKATGKPDWEVANLWKNARWTNRGVLPRPAGWREHWRAWAEEFGVDVSEVVSTEGP